MGSNQEEASLLITCMMDKEVESEEVIPDLEGVTEEKIEESDENVVEVADSGDTEEVPDLVDEEIVNNEAEENVVEEVEEDNCLEEKTEEPQHEPDSVANIEDEEETKASPVEVTIEDVEHVDNDDEGEKDEQDNQDSLPAEDHDEEVEVLDVAKLIDIENTDETVVEVAPEEDKQENNLQETEKQLIGNWSEEFGNIIDCQILENGEIVVKLPSLPAGEYQYKFLINGVPLVDEKMNFKNDMFNHCNILK